MGCGGTKPDNKHRSSSLSKNHTIKTYDELKFNPGMFVKANDRKFLDVYKLGEVMGKGAFGEVRWCLQKDTGARRAVKIFRKESLGQGENRNKLITEIEILKTLDHPNIVRVYEFFEDPKRLFIVMELCRGGELFDEIVKRSSFGERQAAQIMQQLFSAVAYLHDNNIIHRDLKPENILLEEKHDYLNIKLIDFGTAVLHHGNERVRGAIGTAYYIAPEVVMGSYDKKCDLWSCGIIMYILLSGCPPFEGDSDREIVEKVKKGKYSLEGQAWTNISSQAKDLIGSLLVSPTSRITASEALQHPWILQYATREGPSTALMHNALQNLGTFNSKNKLRDAVHTFITTQLINSKETKEIREIFRTIDKNGDGKLSKEELLEHYYEIVGPSLAEAEVSKIMTQVDTDNNGYIDYTEFIKASLDMKKVFNKENLRIAFQMFDKDGSGSISASELRKVLENGAPTDDEVWNGIVNEVDQNGDGEIDIKEFEEIIMAQIQ